MIRRLPASLAGLSAMLAAPPALAETAGAAAKRVLADPAYQTELPGTLASTLRHWHQHWHLDLSDLGPLAELLLYLAAASLVILLLVGIGRGLAGWRDHRRRRHEGPSPAGLAAAAALAAESQPALVDADRLAALGDFAAAIHLLLLAAIEAIRLRMRATLAASATSREILRHTPLPEGNRAAFASLIVHVELCHFGGRPADAALYGACRDSFMTALAARPA